MIKCVICNKKSKRLCPALNERICSLCCGTKRDKEIKCISECNFYLEGKSNENEKIIMKLIKESFNDDWNDLFYDEEYLNIIGPLETFLLSEFYNDESVNDNSIFKCLIKMYFKLKNEGDIYSYIDYENIIVDTFSNIVEENEASIELQKTILLRLMKSIYNVSGGVLGNRNYLELLRGQFTGTGRMSGMFCESE